MTIPPDFVSWMLSEVKRVSEFFNCADNRAFPVWVMKSVFDSISEEDAFEYTDTLTQGDAGLDGWYLDQNAQVFHLIQSKFLSDPINGTINPGELDSLIKAALLLKSPSAVEAGPHHDKLTRIAIELEEALQNDVSVSLDIFLAGRLSDASRQLLEDAVSNMDGNFSLAIYDTEKLYELKLADDPISDLSGKTVDFVISPSDGFFEMQDLQLPGIDKAAVLALDGKSLAEAVDKNKANLFHANVRYFLRASNRVNKRMIETLDDDEERRAFWLYNNGLTMVADSFSFEPDGEQTVLRAINPQIVNGAQTSSVLRERRAKLAVGEVAVQCRVIAIPNSEEGRTALEKISEFTNSQSPVKPSDLRANDRRHKAIQRNFGLLQEPVFYERRRGEWQSLTAGKRATYGGRRVTKEEAGQHFLAYSGRPAESVTKKEAIFGDFESEAFNSKVSAHVYMLAHELHLEAVRLLSAKNAQEMLDLVPSFNSRISTPDSPTQLEVVRRATGLVAAHATCLAQHILFKRYSDIGPRRAQGLRKLLSEHDSDQYKFVWKFVFRSIRQWVTNQPDKTAIKALLQRTEAIDSMKLTLIDHLADVDMSVLPPVTS